MLFLVRLSLSAVFWFIIALVGLSLVLILTLGEPLHAEPLHADPSRGRTYYLQHAAERERVLASCREYPGEAPAWAGCANARAGEVDAAMVEAQRRGVVYSPTDVRFWLADPFSLAEQLRQCDRLHIVHPWCGPAHAAATRLAIR